MSKCPCCGSKRIGPLVEVRGELVVQLDSQQETDDNGKPVDWQCVTCGNLFSVVSV